MPRNNEFKSAVFSVLASIPSGKVISYGQLAKLAGYPNHHRQAAKLLSNFPADSTLPWHRVILASGMCGEFTNQKEQIKRLKKEGHVFSKTHKIHSQHFFAS